MIILGGDSDINFKQFSLRTNIKLAYGSCISRVAFCKYSTCTFCVSFFHNPCHLQQLLKFFGRSKVAPILSRASSSLFWFQKFVVIDVEAPSWWATLDIKINMKIRISFLTQHALIHYEQISTRQKPKASWFQPTFCPLFIIYRSIFSFHCIISCFKFLKVVVKFYNQKQMFRNYSFSFEIYIV